MILIGHSEVSSQIFIKKNVVHDKTVMYLFLFVYTCSWLNEHHKIHAVTLRTSRAFSLQIPVLSYYTEYLILIGRGF